MDGDRQGVLRKITEEGQIRAELYTSFSAMEMTKPDVFPSLLFYYGMLTIVGTRGSQLILSIPNNNVRKQYYNYLLENYDKACQVRTSNGGILEIKYLPKKDFAEKSEEQWQEAVSQIQGYARAPRVETLRQGTQLHLIVMQFCGWELARMEEV